MTNPARKVLRRTRIEDPVSETLAAFSGESKRRAVVPDGSRGRYSADASHRPHPRRRDLPRVRLGRPARPCAGGCGPRHGARAGAGWGERPREQGLQESRGRLPACRQSGARPDVDDRAGARARGAGQARRSAGGLPADPPRRRPAGSARGVREGAEGSEEGSAGRRASPRRHDDQRPRDRRGRRGRRGRRPRRGPGEQRVPRCAEARGPGRARRACVGARLQASRDPGEGTRGRLRRRAALARQGRRLTRATRRRSRHPRSGLRGPTAGAGGEPAPVGRLRSRSGGPRRRCRGGRAGARQALRPRQELHRRNVWTGPAGRAR